MRKNSNLRNENGFSLIELLIAVLLIGLLAAYFLSPVRSTAAESKKLLADASRSLRERRTAAIRLMQPNAAGFKNFSPVVINFADRENTGRLVIEGQDKNNDGVDDNSNERLTRYNERDNDWNYAYEDQGINIPEKWKTVEHLDDLGKIPPIPGAYLTTEIKFGQDGRCAEPPPLSEETARDEAPFYAIYFLETSANPKGSTKLAAAVAFHCSGLVEEWTYNSFDKEWQGNGGRK